MDGKSFYLQDFVGLNFGRVPGSFKKSDFFPTKKPSMVAKHFSLKDHVFLLHQCYRLRQAGHDSVSVLKNEILSYFECSEEYRNSLRLDYETHMKTNIPMKEAKQLLAFLKIIGSKLEYEMKRITRLNALLKGTPLSPTGLQIFFHDKNSFSCSFDKDFTLEWSNIMKEEIKLLYKSLKEWNDNESIKEKIIIKGEKLDPSVSDFLDGKIHKLDINMNNLKQIVSSLHAQPDDSEFLVELKQEKCNFVKKFEDFYENKKKRYWIGKRWNEKISFVPPFALLLADDNNFPQLSSALNDWNSEVKNFPFGLGGINENYKESLSLLFDKEVGSLCKIVSSFRQIYKRFHSKYSDLSAEHSKTQVCSNVKSFDECFQKMQSSLGAYVDSMFLAVLGDEKQPKFADYCGESVLLSVLWHKFLNSSSDVQEYFFLVKEFEPEFYLELQVDNIYRELEVQAINMFQFISIPYSSPVYKGFQFPNCMEAVVRDFIRLLVESNVIEFEISNELEFWTNNLSDQPNIVYFHVSNENDASNGWVKSSKNYPHGIIEQNGKKYSIYDASKEVFGYEMAPSMLNLLVSVDSILQRGFFSDWDFKDYDDGIRRGNLLLVSLELKLNIRYNSVVIEFVNKGIEAIFDFHHGNHASLTVNFDYVAKRSNKIRFSNNPELHSLEFIQYCINSSYSDGSISIEETSDGPFAFFNTLSQILLECKVDSLFHTLLTRSYPIVESFKSYILGSIHEYEVAKLILNDKTMEQYKIPFARRIIQENPNSAFGFYKLIEFETAGNLDLYFEGLSVQTSLWSIGKSKRNSNGFEDITNYFTTNTLIFMDDQEFQQNIVNFRALFNDLPREFGYFNALSNQSLDIESSFVKTQIIDADSNFMRLYWMQAIFESRREYLSAFSNFYLLYPISMSVIFCNHFRTFVDYREMLILKRLFKFIKLEHLVAALNIKNSPLNFDLNKFTSALRFFDEQKVSQLGEMMASKYPHDCLMSSSLFLKISIAKRLVRSDKLQIFNSYCLKKLVYGLKCLDFLFVNEITQLFEFIIDKIFEINDITRPIVFELIKAKFKGIIALFVRIFPQKLLEIRNLRNFMEKYGHLDDEEVSQIIDDLVYA